MTGNETAKTLNGFFSNTFKTLHISKFYSSDPVSDNVNDLTLKAVSKDGNIQVL